MLQMSSGSTTSPASLRFGEDFEFDVGAFELRRAGRSLKLKPVPMKLLLFLLEHRGKLVSREEIVDHIWGKEVFLDTDNSINVAISKIRQVLHDDPEKPRFVLTVPSRGYRFIAPVTEAGKERAPFPASPAKALDLAEPPQTARP